MTPPRALLIDLDDTLYAYAPAEKHAREATMPVVAHDLSLSIDEADQMYSRARERVKSRLGHRGSAHSRLLYFLDLAHASKQGATALSRVRSWERTFWNTYLEHAELHLGARSLLLRFRETGGKIAVVTDLTAEVQLWKLESMKLFELVDAIAVSEEVEHDKPATAVFELAIERLGVARETCVVVGDSEERDGGGAKALRLPFYRVTREPGDGGMSLEDIGRAIGVLP